MKQFRQAARGVLGEQAYESLRRRIARVRYRGDSFYCPCCDSGLRCFVTGGLHAREGVRCPVCRSLERHRLIWLYLTNRTDLFDGRPKRLLHVAPEPMMTSLFKSVEGVDYLSADLSSPLAMVKMDITDIQYPDDSFDVIYCSHVLEHVPEDRQAMREFYRVLKPGGWAILQVPIVAEKTFEDPTATTPEERERKYGQHNHVRAYGFDYADRLREAGFEVLVDGFAREMPDEDAERQKLQEQEDVYFCRKLDG